MYELVDLRSLCDIIFYVYELKSFADLNSLMYFDVSCIDNI